MKVSKHAIISVILIFFTIFLGHTTETGFSIGDKILLGLGISPWSNGQTGFHYPVVIYFALFIIGCLEARRIMTIRQLLILLLLLFILTPSVVSFVKPYYYGIHRGLDSVEYDSRNSNFNIRGSNDKKKIEVLGAVVLTNYGKDTIKFGIKIPSDNFFPKELFPQDLILTEVENSEEPGNFILHSGETRTILSYNSITVKNGYYGQGGMQGPILILYTEDESRTVGNNL
ncbi:hypothetical protein [Desulfosporosinus meridiei]|uniref:Uncharacterized protein n=1 Tax=Desulfosporosinus meridiei (strain ATCC BAA-275 / DSM 13257 / KCTC 12902 / NCIMB 13706 / S10) TaxID=768704 RepID=J7IZ63_DESMD|nr:hypothetical protein [Desulfosporosinus meridiei]AFQ44338.1 hypothetical protein Desmer_2416 [Desulfosporosinus meridiei DSM 13257]